MPRGTETQEPNEKSQETRDTTPEAEEVKEESQRLDDAAVESEAVVESVRSVQESEKIEAELIAAIEAVDLAAEETDSEVSATPINTPGAAMEDPEDQISATPITLPVEGPEDQISATPITLPERTSDEISATPIPFPDELPEAARDEVSATPINTPGGNDEISEVVAERASAETVPAPAREEDPPRPPQGTIEGNETALSPDDVKTAPEGMLPEEEQLPGAEIPGEMPAELDGKGEMPAGLDGKGETPVGEVREPIGLDTALSTEQAELDGKGEMPAGSGEDIETDPTPMPSPVESTGEAENDSPSTQELIEDHPAELEVPGDSPPAEEGDEGGSILIGGEEEELEQIDLSTEAAKEVDEFWEPPEMYVYQHKDGSIEFVDKNGKLIDSPPQYKVNTKDNTIQAWYQGAEKGDVFNVKEFSGYSSNEIYAYHGQDGSITFVDANGIPVPSPPPVVIEGGLVCISKKVGTGYSNSVVQEYSPPMDGIYAHTNQDGSIDIVDKNGNLVQSPPHFFRDGLYLTVYANISGAQPIEIPKYNPPLDDIYIYTGQDGSLSVVDKDGNLVKSPPIVARLDTDEVYTSGPEGEKVKISQYVPPTTDIFAYKAQDGTISIVDKDGKQVNCPPHIKIESNGNVNVSTQGTDGSKINIKEYKPPLKDVFLYIGQNGYVTIVDKLGKQIDSPPHLEKIVDWQGNVHYYANYTGLPVEQKVELKNYKPPSGYGH